MNDFKKTHFAVCGGGNFYTSKVPCEKCGSLLFRHDKKDCHSCYQKAINEQRYKNHGDHYRNRQKIDRIHDTRALEKELDSYSGV